MFEALEYPFFQRALAAALAASVACGIVGSYVVVRRIASISGGLAHAAFGGVGLGYLLGFDPMLGATLFALACSVGLGLAERKLRSGFDTLIAMVWAVGMALGILFVSLAPGYAPDLMSYLFGSLLFVPARYVGMVLLLDLVIVITVALLFKEFQAVCFDEEGAQIVGVPVAAVQQILLALVALAVVILIRVVGVILVIALLTVPAAIARQWADTLLKTMIVAIVVGAVCSSGGLFLSFWLADWYEVNLPTGPLIVLLAVSVYGLSSLVRTGSRSSAARSRVAN
jgi:zinc transport system permease protein